MTTETKAADAFAQLLRYIGDTDNLQHWATEFEDSFPSPIIRVYVVPEDDSEGLVPLPPAAVVAFEDGSAFCLTVTQTKKAAGVPA